MYLLAHRAHNTTSLWPPRAQVLQCKSPRVAGATFLDSAVGPAVWRTSEDPIHEQWAENALPRKQTEETQRGRIAPVPRRDTTTKAMSSPTNRSLPRCWKHGPAC
ncbi:unnamed protein product [Prorocentrum cordatum]|uniref:Uncharacterized protein n=1 Tax=Prorocentrum cordatum TaxID=2364126 RepID=A0ABN9QGP7_9DINO|nr:unnamed protein product [Polarella glacialis]